MTEALQKARSYELKREKEIASSIRPCFHLTPRVGWMNDPNGFSFYNGRYHLFYQYNPYDTVWGPMHWGHAASSDLIHWEYLPCALAPDTPADKDGCFSGTALTLSDGQQLLMYTGAVHIPTADGGEEEIQKQCIAIGDGLDYVKYEGNPVLDAGDLPENASPNDFRDPKVWRHKDGTYRAVVAARDEERAGELLLFGSEDALHWHYRKTLLVNDWKVGRMWECPDFFELDGKQVFLAGGQGPHRTGGKYHTGDNAFYMLGNWDEDAEVFSVEYDDLADAGLDFYAQQTMQAPDGRRIMVGWMQNWLTGFMARHGQPWFGQMTLPRELFLKDGRLYQRPIREFDALRTDPVSYRSVAMKNEERIFEGISGRVLDLEVRVRPTVPVEKYHKFSLQFAKDEQHYTEFTYRPYERLAMVDRSHSGWPMDTEHLRSSILLDDPPELKLRLVLDRFSAEVFLQDGERAMSLIVFTPQEAEEIRFGILGEAELDVVKYGLAL